jgi:hypothetical protein
VGAAGDMLGLGFGGGRQGLPRDGGVIRHPPFWEEARAARRVEARLLPPTKAGSLQERGSAVGDLSMPLT